ncbi:phage tail tape measure protein [Lysinibacillus sp. fkY74-1]
MAGNIKGITVEIGGNTTKLTTALREVDGQSRSLQRELKAVERGLKFDSGNVQLAAQRQQILRESVTQTSQRLETLRQAQAQVDAQFARGEIGADQYRAFQREVMNTESQLNRLQGQLTQVTSKWNQMDTAIRAAGERMKAVGDRMKSIGSNMSMYVTAPLAAMGATVAKIGMDFEAGMSKVAAISGATGAEFQQLHDKARELGATTKFSATEVSEGFMYMSMAGWDATKMLDGIGGVLNLAAASGEDLGLVSDIVTDALTALGMSADQTGRFVDVLAAATSKSNTNVAMLGESFKYAAPVAGALGYSAEDVSLALGLMANAGIKASNSGTALRSMMTNLASPTKAMNDAMNDLGISLTDNENNMKPLKQVLDELRVSLTGLDADTQAAYAATIFGKEAMAGALAIVNASEEDYNNLANAINNSAGTAEKMAKIMSDNLAGRIKEMQSALEEVALTLYEKMQPALEFVVKIITKLAEWFGKLSGSTQLIIIAIAAVAAAIGPVVLVIGALISAIGTIMTVMGAALVPVLAIVAGIAALGAAFVVLWKKSETFRDGVKAVFEAIKEVVMTALDAVVTFVKAKLDEIKKFWDENGAQIMQAVQNVWGVIQKIFEFVMPIIMSIVKDAWNNIKNIIDGVLKVIMGLVKVFTGLFTGDWGKMWEGVKQVLSGAVQAVWNVIELWFMGKILGVFKTFGKFVKELFDKLGTSLKGIWDKIGSVASTAWNKVKDVIMKPVEGAKKGASDAFDALKNAISTASTAIWNAVKSKFEPLKDLMVKPIETAKNLIKSAIDAIKGFFSGLKLKFPKIEMPKLPRFTLKGEFSLKPPSVPKIGIDWFAKGGIMNSPTAFGMNGNNLMVGGEAGREAILPLNARNLSGIGEGIAKHMGQQSQQQVVYVQPAPIYLDGQQVAEVTFDHINGMQYKQTNVLAVTKGVQL